MASATVIDVVMPQMGVSVSEGTIVKWLVNEGETIEADAPLLEISTDKVDTEVPSPGTGVVTKILVQEGETVDVGTKLAEIAPEGRGAGGRAEPEPAPEPATAEAAAEADAPSSAETPAPVAPAEPAPAAAPASDNGKTFVSPVVARIAAEHGVDVGSVPGHRPGRPRDEEGHPRLHRAGGAQTAPAPARPPHRRNRALRQPGPGTRS